MDAFKNQYFSVLGDSISTFDGYLPDGYPSFYSRLNRDQTGVFAPEETWWHRVISHFGGQLLVNNSWSGSYVCKAPRCEVESYGCSDARTGGLDADGVMPDQILIYMGTNDRGACFPLVSEDKSDLSVIENAYGVMLDKIKKNYPRAEIWCCTFPITSCSRNPYFWFPDKQMGVPMTAYGELIHRVAEARGCHVIELRSKKHCDTIDGLHPNYDGMKTIADHVIAAMEADRNGYEKVD